MLKKPNSKQRLLYSHFKKNFAAFYLRRACHDAFTLVEMLMALLIISVILSASLPVITQRTKAQIQNYSRYSPFPIGGIIVWGSAKPLPDNTWLECNGQAVPGGIEYEKIRQIYGAKLPDYRGVFLRGSGSVSFAGNAYSSSGIGLLQTDEIKSHTHTMQAAGNHYHLQGSEALYNFYGGGYYVGSRLWGSEGIAAYVYANTSTAGAHTHFINATGSNETRPINKAVRYIIKVRS